MMLSHDTIAVHCLHSGGGALTLSLAAVLRSVRPNFRRWAVYQLSLHGALFELLRCAVADLKSSEFFDDVPLSERRGGVLCQDVRQLSLGDGSFETWTSIEVFEQVPDDKRGFAESRRVLAPGGAYIFTVPLSDEPTLERVMLEDGRCGTSYRPQS